MGLVSREIGGWGRYPVRSCRLSRPEQVSHAARLISEASSQSYLGRGLGRAYGDAALNSQGTVVLSERLDRFLDFDSRTGLLRCEAGVCLSEILQVFLPRGWFLPVTPGTRFATIGGCVACDVHGKNHHMEGSLSHHVRSIVLLGADGRATSCSRETLPELFRATVGGMGLTGFILECEIQLKPVETAYIDVEYHRTRDLAETMELIDREDQRFVYSVAWMDCLAAGRSLGRSVLMRGNHCRLDQLEASHREAPLRVSDRRAAGIPFDFPALLLNRGTIGVMNSLYYRCFAAGRSRTTVHYEPYFYPLDRIRNWNRAYGKRGFIQYQCTFPLEQSASGIELLLGGLKASRMGSFLVVLKRFGRQGGGLLSFPFKGYTISLDFPVSDRLEGFLEQLDSIVLAHQGRVYLAKDARLSPATFRAMYPGWQEWLRIKREVDPHNRFDSDLARRIGLTGGGN